MVCPVTKEAASEHNHTTASAISSGLPILPMGSREIYRSSAPGFRAMTPSVMGVRMAPGQTALILMPVSAYSRAAAFHFTVQVCPHYRLSYVAILTTPAYCSARLDPEGDVMPAQTGWKPGPGQHPVERG